jgi:superfamily II DNA/RNA helicase
VINYDLPRNAEDYVHRIGRTGRAGASGEAIALFAPEEERYLLDIEKLIKTKIPRGELELPRSIARRRPVGGHHGTPGRHAHEAPLDDFFSRPYEPAVAAPRAEAEPRPAVVPARRPVGVLLGGGKPV